MDDKNPKQHLIDQTSTYDDEKDWGDPIVPKDSSMIRIMMENINNIGLIANNNPKQEALMEWIIQNDVDVACWLEIGIAWQTLRRKDHLLQRLHCEQWQNARVVTSNNRHDSTHLSQPGGTATLTFGPISNTIDKRGYDPSGLGRWSWIQLSGRHDVNTVIITAYNPCRSSLGRTWTVYSQHKRFWLSKKLDTCPRECMRRDLSQFITQWQDKGANIILCADLNEDTTRKMGHCIRHCSMKMG